MTIKCDARRPLGRLCYLLLTLLLVFGTTAHAQVPQTTQISDIVYRPDGNPAQGTLLISWGRSRLAVEAHNYFGIKAHGVHPWVEFTTTEVAGAPYTTRARFARYNSMSECFADRDALLLRARCYAQARAAMGDPVAFTRALAARWATDPNYADKVLAIYRAHGLDALDGRN